MDNRRRWMALIVLCLGVLMIVLDSTVVNVALPSIRADLGFSETSLVWVVNAYILTFGGFLLLGGRFGDLYGHRRLFLSGLVVFTLASLACGLATSQALLIGARVVQGLGGAVVSAVALSLIMELFVEPAERAKAMGVYGFVCAGGGSVGVLLGGLLTSALMLAVYAIVHGNEAGWSSVQTITLLVVAWLLFLVFLRVESTVAVPLVSLGLFRSRTITVSNIIGVLWAAAMFAWFFISALYLQRVLGYSPLEVGLAFLPANLIMAAFSVGLSAVIVMRYGIKWPLAIGLLLAACGLLLFARMPLNGDFVVDVLPGMVLLGMGAGMAFNPVLLAAMSEAGPGESGLASGLVNTSFMMGGAVGLAVLASLADARSSSLSVAGQSLLESLNGGYQGAFMGGAVFALLAAVLSIMYLPWTLRETEQVLGVQPDVPD